MFPFTESTVEGRSGSSGISRKLGACLIAAVPSLQIAAEYLATGDSGRAASKLVAWAVGLPLLIWGSSAGFRWAARRGIGPVAVFIAGVLSAGALYGTLFCCVRMAGSFAPMLHPQTGDTSVATALRVGFATGVCAFGLWALAYALPFALEVRALEVQAELARIRSHLEPHFLLNTLNAIAGLISEEPRAAQRLLASLGGVLRDSLREDGALQPLGEQIDWLRHYAQILEARHAGQLAFHWDVEPMARAALLPRLLLHPLVALAVEQGALAQRQGGRVVVRAQVDRERTLVCTVEVDGKRLSDLPSIRRRLALQYAGRARFWQEATETGTRSIVEIPLETR
jgi:hypothetical protein